MSRTRRQVSAKNFYIIVGDRLRMCRHAHNKTQDDVAKLLGLSRPSIVNIEIGNQGIDLVQAAQFACLYKIKIDAFTPNLSDDEIKKLSAGAKKP
jgi:transcriptional regulator with XRE-family HTH domain